MEISYYILIFTFLYLLKNHLYRKFKNLPPSPFISFPIIGHLYLFKKPLHKTLAKISAKHGPLLFLRFGSRPVLLVSSPSLAEECFTKNDVVFANRPRLLAGKHLGYNYTTLVWASYGQHWRNLRRIATLEILSTLRVQMFADIRRDEVRTLIQRLVTGKTSVGDSNTNVVDMKEAFFEMTLNILMMMIAGKQYYGDSGDNWRNLGRFKEMTETFQLSGAINIGDFVPMLNWIGVNKLEDKLKLLKEKRDKFMQDLIEEHKNSRKGSSVEQRNNTMIDVLLSLQDSEPEYYTDEVIRGMAIVMLTAGTDTTAGTLEWALSLLLNNPKTLKKAQNEIDTHIGESSRLLDDSDLAQLPYLHGIINETLRMCPAAPILVPHESSDECVVGGFRVPRGTMLLVNLWAIQNDAKLWEDPNEFKPERFIDFKGQRDGFRLIPFGYGRRGCPGENLAMHVAGLALGSLIQCFELKRVSEELVDMTGGPGLTMPKAIPLLAKCRPRQNTVNLLARL
ncbi:cytochrome P450 81Q32-like [Lycium ferocissimum]|uniref:cytochrome P450 81Q32-like n=1 Tax=Lycium ferocissimum TaxID=112874 RepID=UPI00281651CF|nr:cytochrome P450 81Q32-like [Lycium ferocissimum]